MSLEIIIRTLKDIGNEILSMFSDGIIKWLIKNVCELEHTNPANLERMCVSHLQIIQSILANKITTHYIDGLKHPFHLCRIPFVVSTFSKSIYVPYLISWMQNLK